MFFADFAAVGQYLSATLNEEKIRWRIERRQYLYVMHYSTLDEKKRVIFGTSLEAMGQAKNVSSTHKNQ